MSRTLCPSCQRPEKACICHFTTKIMNDIHVVVLQHPSEVSQVKGTIALLAKSLDSCQVLVGENFSGNEQLLQIFEQYHTLLLYPGEEAKALDEHLVLELQEQINTKPLCLVILDGTWKKAYRMYMMSKNLQQLPQVCLPENLANAGQYHIRKVAKKNALSSLEASCYALALLESENETKQVSPDQAGKYQPLLDKFHAFNHFHLSFRVNSINHTK